MTPRCIAFGAILTAWALAGCGSESNPFGPDSDYQVTFQTQPANGQARAVLAPVVVTIQDAAGVTDSSASIPVTLALGANPGGATLSGTLTANAVAGVATFDDLSIDKSGSGYTLVASAGELPTTESGPFDVAFASALALGVWHACVVRSGDDIYCWGYNSNGQLGDGTTTNRTAPVAVNGDVAFVSVAPGGFQTCGLTATGEAYCWGLNNFGQVGDSTTTQRTAPVAVAGEHVFVSLSGGLDHTCGIEAGTFDTYCWGRNAWGQLGDGTTANSSVPTVILGSSLLGFGTVSAGAQYTCAVTPSGAAYCWGLNNYGQLGDGTTAARYMPMAVTGDSAFQSISASDNNNGFETTCGVMPSGAAYCWGRNDYGQLGGGTTGGRSTEPAEVFGGLEFAFVSPGQDHTCGVTTDGDAYCWGRNDVGQLGNGTAGADQGTNTPSLVSGEHVFRYVGSGQSFSCGITTDDDVYCWGLNNVGQLGDGTTTNSDEPVLVETLPVGIGG